VRIDAAAAEEAAEAAAWYEKERPGLGADFERAVDAALDLLEAEVVPLAAFPGVAGTRGVKRLFLRRARVKSGRSK
jgi:toxin ParE1/3/4